MNMKPNIIKGFIVAFVLVAVLSSCNTDKIDYPDRYQPTNGVPTIDYIRYADRDVLIDQAFMDEAICLVGSNLTSIVEVYFNDQKAILNTSFITDKTMVVNVPKKQAVEKTDKIYLTTKEGRTLQIDFKVLPPAPLVNSLSCEYTAPGQKATIYGEYFIDVEYIEFQGVGARIEASDITIESSTAMSFTIPSTAEAGMVKVKTASGLSGSSFHYLDSRGLLFDFDGKTGLGNHGWHNMVIEDDGTGITGQYLKLGDGNATLNADGGDWNDSVYSFEYWPGDWQDPETYANPAGIRLNDLVDFSGWANMAIKFEMSIPAETPWKGTPLQVIFAPVTAVSNGNAGVVDIYGNVLGGANNEYFHGDLSIPRALYAPWKATGSYDTGGQWVTVTIPIASSFIYNWDSSAPSGELNPDSFASLLLMVAAGGDYGKGEPSSPIIKIDNIRAVPLK